MDLNNTQRRKIYNSFILLKNSQREIDEVIETLADTDEQKVLIQLSLRLEGIGETLNKIVSDSR